MTRTDVRGLVIRLLRPTDADLLARFGATRDEDAFAELVSRHGDMVRGTARRQTGDYHAADDVCQATFLVLARKAGTGGWGPTVGPWLHATAVRLAKKAVRRRTPTPAPSPAPLTDPAATAERGEAYQVLDQELTALPDVLRGPLVLCYLQGRTRDEAAEALGCSLAMLKRRLARGRAVLRDRLIRRGVTVPAAGLTVLLADLRGGPVVADTTARAVVAFVTTGRVPTGVATLVESAGGSGRWVLAAAVGLVALSVGVVPSPGAPGQDPGRPPTATPAEGKVLVEAPGPLPAGAVARLGTTRLRPGGSVERMAFSPDGTKLAAWSMDTHITDALSVWNTKTGEPVRRVDLPGAKVLQLAWLPDGRGIALVKSSWDDPDPYVWEFTDEKAMPPLKPRVRGGKLVVAPPVPEDNEQDSCYAFSPDGKTVAIGKAGELTGDREVRICPIKTGVRVSELSAGKVVGAHPGNCGHLRFTPDGKTLVVLGRPRYVGDKTVYDGKYEDEQHVTVWDPAVARERTRFLAPTPALNGTAVAIAVSDRFLAIGRGNGDTGLWDLTTGKAGTVVRNAGEIPLAVAFDPGGQSLVTAGRAGVPKVWGTDGKLQRAFGRHYGWVEAVVVSADGKTMATAGQDRLIRLWDAATGADACPQPGHKYTVSGAVLSRDGKTVVTTGWDNTLRWWETATGRELRVVEVPQGVDRLTLSPDGTTVLAATDGGRLRTWDLASGRETTPAALPAGVKFHRLTFTPDGKHLLSASGPQLAVCEWPGLKAVRTITMPEPTHTVLSNPPPDSKNHCTGAAVSPDGRHLVTIAYRHMERVENGLTFSSGADGSAFLWDFATGKVLCELVESPVTFRSLAFTADGRLILVGGSGKARGPDAPKSEEFDGEINLLDPVAGRRVRRFDAPAAAASVASRRAGESVLSPDGRTLYVAYSTGEIIGFEVATGHPRRTLTGHAGYIAGMAVSADGRRLITGGGDGSAVVWDVSLTGAGGLSGGPGDEQTRWTALADAGAAHKAYAAMAALAATPDRAVELVRREVRPASGGADRRRGGPPVRGPG